MKRFAACLVVSAFAASSAYGGTVGFNYLGTSAGVESYDVSIATADFPVFDSVNLLFGSDTSGLNFGWTYAQSFEDTVTLPTNPGAPFMVRASDLFAGGFNSANTWSAPLLVGTLTVDTNGLSGPAVVEVSSDWESTNLGAMLSGLTGAGPMEGLSGSITVPIPEPATLMLLGLGGVAVLRRRKA